MRLRVGFFRRVGYGGKGSKYGYIDKNNKIVIPLTYEFALNFSSGLASVKTNGNYELINKKNAMIVPAVYQEAAELREGITRVRLNNKYGL
ncbi:MAG: WG repeat-containing protein [Chitinophagaceae bacterium]